MENDDDKTTDLLCSTTETKRTKQISESIAGFESLKYTQMHYTFIFRRECLLSITNKMFSCCCCATLQLTQNDKFLIAAQCTGIIFRMHFGWTQVKAAK